MYEHVSKKHNVYSRFICIGSDLVVICILYIRVYIFLLIYTYINMYFYLCFYYMSIVV